LGAPPCLVQLTVKKKKSRPPFTIPKGDQPFVFGGGGGGLKQQKPPQVGLKGEQGAFFPGPSTGGRKIYVGLAKKTESLGKKLKGLFPLQRKEIPEIEKREFTENRSPKG